MTSTRLNLNEMMAWLGAEWCRRAAGVFRWWPRRAVAARVMIAAPLTP
jgi:hypothetical protein